MNRITRFITFVALALSTAAAHCANPTKPEIIQQIGGFNRPVSAVFSPDERFLFVANHAQGESGTLRQQSFVSRLAVDDQGKVAVDQMRFLDGITAPVDMDFSPVDIGNLPAGALFVVAGSPLVQDDAGRALKDLSRVMVGLLVLDPRSGRLIETIDLSPNSDLRLEGDANLLSPTSLSFDSAGNLYIGESGIGGHMFPRRQVGRPGIWRLKKEAVAELLEGKSPTQSELIRTTSMPGDMCYRDKEDMLYFITNHTHGAPSGSVFRMPSADYQGISSMQTLVRGIGALSSVQITPPGRVLIVGNSGELMFPRGKKNTRPIRFRPKVDFSTPGKIGLISLKDGTVLVAVPEQSSDAGLGQGQRISMVALPSDY